MESSGSFSRVFWLQYTLTANRLIIAFLMKKNNMENIAAVHTYTYRSRYGGREKWMYANRINIRGIR
jgi:hypothetical protein